MTIYRAKTFLDIYRFKAKSGNVHELSGRTGRPDLTEFILERLANRLIFQREDRVVDIGCGNALLLRKAALRGVNGWVGRLVGILPTSEEIYRVQQHFIQNPSLGSESIQIAQGFLTKIPLPNGFATKTIVNNLLHYESTSTVRSALCEIHRITCSGGRVFLGEVADQNEMEGKNYGNSIFLWLIWVLKNQGLRRFSVSMKQTLVGLLTSEPLIVGPKNFFYMTPSNFISLVQDHGFRLLEHEKSLEIDINGNIFDSPRRWNYMFEKN